MKKYFVIVSMALLLLVTGCGNTKEEMMTCTRTGNMSGVEMDFTYNIYYQGVIVNKMGINHPIKEEPYKNFTDKELIKWYDNCFVMMIHAIRTVQVNKIKNERKQLLNN